jgi:hypothetical protein
MTPSKMLEREPDKVGQVSDKPFDNILNFRDVGKTINEFIGEKYVRTFAPSNAETLSDVLLKDDSTAQPDRVGFV